MGGEDAESSAEGDQKEQRKSDWQTQQEGHWRQQRCKGCSVQMSEARIAEGWWWCERCTDEWLARDASAGAAAPKAAPSDLVFVVGLPKCGTTSLQHALEDAGYGAVHCYAPKPRISNKPEDRFVGQLMLKAVEEGKAPLAFLPTWVNAVTQMDCWWVDWQQEPAAEPSGDLATTDSGGGSDRPCSATALFPQMLILDELDRAYPDAKFILNIREARQWLRSVDSYGRLREILVNADVPGLPRGRGADDAELLEWFESHTAKVQEHFAGREGSKLLTFTLEEDDESIRKKLVDFLGVKLDWGCHNVTTWA